MADGITMDSILSEAADHKSSPTGLEIIQAVPNKDNGSPTEEVMNCDDDDNETTYEQLAYVANMIRCLDESGKENPTTMAFYYDKKEGAVAVTHSSAASKRKRDEQGQLEFTCAEPNACPGGLHEEIGPMKMQHKQPQAVKNALAEVQEPIAVKEAASDQHEETEVVKGCVPDQHEEVDPAKEDLAEFHETMTPQMIMFKKALAKQQKELETIKTALAEQQQELESVKKALPVPKDELEGFELALVDHNEEVVMPY